MSKEKSIKFLKVRDVTSPTRANKYDAGIDFYVPSFNEKFIEYLIDNNPQLFVEETSNNGCYLTSGTGNGTFNISNGTTSIVNYNSIESIKKDDHKLIGYDLKKGPYFMLLPHNRVMIPSGIKSRMAEPGRALIAANKSGISTKYGIVFGAQVVDYTYKGEIHISVINTSTKIIKIFQGQKLIQFVETPVFNSKIEVINHSDNVVDDGILVSTQESNFYNGLEDDRGEGGMGSTGE